MNPLGRSALAAGAVLFLGIAPTVGCQRRHEEPLPPPSATAVDHLAPGELVDGPLHAFELKLPVGMQIGEAFSSVVYAWGPVDPMKLANYLRGQVKGGSISVGAAATVFDQVTVPANPKRTLRLRVDATSQGRAARLEVRDVTPLPAVPAKDDVERWKRAGMSPDGTLLDPSHLH